MFSSNLKKIQMNLPTVMIEKTEAGAVLPRKMTPFAAGYDLYLPRDVTLAAYNLTVVSLGFKVLRLLIKQIKGWAINVSSKLSKVTQNLSKVIQN